MDWLKMRYIHTGYFAHQQLISNIYTQEYQGKGPFLTPSLTIQPQYAFFLVLRLRDYSRK